MPSRILALHTDGISTTGAVFRRRKSAPEEVARATAVSADVSAALTEILRALKEGGTSVPKHVILASDRAVVSRAEMPIHPSRPRAYAQMRELARWESEMAFSDLPSWDVEGILFAMGALTDKSNARVKEEIAHREGLSMGGPAPRFQDVALSMGVIDRGRRDAAVELREILNQPVGEAGVGWVPVTGRDPGDGVQHPWLLSAVAQGEREAWAAACRENKLTLTGILPAWGLSEQAARADLDKDARGGARLLLERHEGGLALANLSGDTVESLRMINLSRPDADERDVIHRILDGREQERLLAVGFAPDMLSDIRAAIPEVTTLDDRVGVFLTGAAARGLGLRDQPDWPAMVAPAEPSPPIWKNDNFLRGGLLAMVVLGIGAFDLTTRYEKTRNQARLDEIQEDLDQRIAIANQVRQTVSRAAALEEKIKATKIEISDLKDRERRATYLQVRRQEIAQGVLSVMRDAIPQGVVLREITESHRAPEVFTVTAWALKDIDAEQFIAALNARAAPLGLVVIDEAVYSERGPRDLPGYTARLRLVPDGYRLPDDPTLEGDPLR